MAIVLAMVTRKAVLSLLAGIFCGALITNRWEPIGAVCDFAEIHLWPTLADSGKLRIFAFTLTMGAMIGVISRSGGMLGLIDRLKSVARSRRSGQLTIWFSGMVIFFDDYANTVLLGGTLRPLSDRLKISREKLAYIVDSTAAPLASLAFLSTWIAVELDYISEGIEGVQGQSPSRAMEVFLASIPYRFYAIMALVMVPLLVILNRDFGPMLEAERRVLRSDEDGSHADLADPQTHPSEPASWWTAIVPIVVTLAVVLLLLYTTGKAAISADTDGSISLRDVLGAADSSLALQYGSIVGLATAALICLQKKLLNLDQIRGACWGGMKVVFPAILILWTASTLSRLTGAKSVDGRGSETFEFQDHRLYTGQYVADLILSDAVEASQQSNGAAADSSTRVPTVVRLLPTLVFLLAAVLSFSTGTSFGTMGLLMPMAVTMTAPLVMATSTAGAIDVLSEPLMLAAVASVLSGAVFGDHCSPISDTTILSSQACGCDHIAHVMTQLPYAVSVGLVSVIAGTIPIGWGFDWIGCVLLQVVLLVGIVLLFGRRSQVVVDHDPISAGS